MTGTTMRELNASVIRSRLRCRSVVRDFRRRDFAVGYLAWVCGRYVWLVLTCVGLRVGERVVLLSVVLKSAVCVRPLLQRARSGRGHID